MTIAVGMYMVCVNVLLDHNEYKNPVMMKGEILWVGDENVQIDFSESYKKLNVSTKHNTEVKVLRLNDCLLYEDEL